MFEESTHTNTHTLFYDDALVIPAKAGIPWSGVPLGRGPDFGDDKALIIK